MANALKLPLARPIAGRVDAHGLPLPLNRPLGTLDDSGGNNGSGNNAGGGNDGGGGNSPRQMVLAGCVWAGVGALGTTTRCLSQRQSGVHVADEMRHRYGMGAYVAQCMYLYTRAFIPITHCLNGKLGGVLAQGVCVPYLPAVVQAMASCVRHAYHATISYRACLPSPSAPVVHHDVCWHLPVDTVYTLTAKLDGVRMGAWIYGCGWLKLSAVMSVPCRYYPAPEILPPTPRACRLPPPADRLPLTLGRKRGRLSARALPLALICWHDTHTQSQVPNLRSYIVHHHISANVAGIDIAPLAFNITTDMDSYCWQAQVALSASDYARIRHLDRPIMTLSLDGYEWVVRIERVAQTRRFINHSYELIGCSLSSALDVPMPSALNQASYASQLVNEALSGTGISCDYAAPDWLIPDGVYELSNRLKVLHDVAAACGAWVYSHPNEPKVIIRSRWQVAAWQMAVSEPDRIIAMDAVLAERLETRDNAHYNSVVVTSHVQGGIVYRTRLGQDKHAPSYEHKLATDQDAIIGAGTAILSDSGRHDDIQLTMPIDGRVGLSPALLGDIWQINDTDAYRARVVSVTISADTQDGVPMVKQVVGLDRYRDG